MTFAVRYATAALLAAYIQVRDLAARIGIEAGDEMQFDQIGDGTLRLKKA